MTVIAPAGDNRSWLRTLVDRAFRRNEPVDGVELPGQLEARLRLAAKSWIRNGSAPGPLYVNGDLARARARNDADPHHPNTLAWLFGRGGATAIDAVNLGALIGRAVSITSACRRGGGLDTGETMEGVLLGAEERRGFVRFTLEQDGHPVEVPFFGDLRDTSYLGIQHGHMIRETHDSAFRPDADHRGLTVYARAFHGGAERSVDQPAIGKVIDQDERSILLRTPAGEELRFEAPSDGFLQVVVVPSTSLPASGTRAWSDRFASLGELAGQPLRIHFDPVGTKSSIEAQLIAVVPDGSGVRLKYRLEGGIEAESSFSSPLHVVVAPSTQPRKIEKGAAEAPSYLGQLVDAMLVDARVASSGYGAHWWKEEQVLEQVRGEVIEQSQDKLVIRAVNGELKTLDLGALESHQPMTGFHSLSATPYLHVRPHGLWA